MNFIEPHICELAKYCKHKRVTVLQAKSDSDVVFCLQLLSIVCQN